MKVEITNSSLLYKKVDEIRLERILTFVVWTTGIYTVTIDATSEQTPALSNKPHLIMLIIMPQTITSYVCNQCYNQPIIKYSSRLNTKRNTCLITIIPTTYHSQYDTFLSGTWKKLSLKKFIGKRFFIWKCIF